MIYQPCVSFGKCYRRVDLPEVHLIIFLCKILLNSNEKMLPVHEQVTVHVDFQMIHWFLVLWCLQSSDWCEQHSHPLLEKHWEKKQFLVALYNKVKLFYISFMN